MAAAFIRGHMLQFTGRFIREDPVLRTRVSPTVLDQIRKYDATVKPTEWRPRQELTSLWGEIARTTEPQTDQAVYQTLLRCGEKVGSFAATTFLKLLLKVLTPKMFASKFPDFYNRDHQGGQGVVEEVERNRAVLLARGVKGYDHFGPVTVGWSLFLFQGMGVKNVKMTCAPWSLAEPGPEQIRFVITWD